MSGDDSVDEQSGKIGHSNEARELAEFIEQISGDLISNGLGLISDRLAYLRIRQALSLRDKVIDELNRRGIKEAKKVAPKFLIPLLEAATLEEDDNLHTRYATLLTNARDPNCSGEIKRSFVSLLEDLEPIDALVLDVSHDSLVHLPKSRLASLDRLVQVLQVPRNQAEISVRNLVRLGS